LPDTRAADVPGVRMCRDYDILTAPGGCRLRVICTPRWRCGYGHTICPGGHVATGKLLVPGLKPWANSSWTPAGSFLSIDVP